MFFEYFHNLKRFESYLVNLFWRSLQSKETQKVHRHFCPENRKNGLRNSRVATLKPVFKLKKPKKPRKTPKGRKETQFALVDKLRFFYGGDGGIRTLDLTDANRTLSQLSYTPESGLRF